MELAVPMKSYEDLLNAQKDLFENQIEKLQDIVATQCNLTGVNPLSQEMAAGALSIKIGKRPRDLLNPKAVKYMHYVFSIKDAINKRETREMSAQFGVTVTQVRDFFNGQRARVRKFAQLSREKINRSTTSDGMCGGIASTPDPNMPVEPIPISTMAPTNIHEEPSCSNRPEILSGIEESDKHFIENIFSLMRKEESFSEKVKLLKWILRMENPSVLNWFLTEGGLMILATWLSEAAIEEQTSFLRVLLKVLHYLPMIKALPVHMSAVLQSVNSLRFYRTPDISHRARVLLSKLSNMFGKKLSSKKNNGSKSIIDSEDEMLLKQSINEVMANEPWDSKDGNSDEVLKLLGDNPDNKRKLDAAPQPVKMLTAPGDESNKRRGVLPSHMKERRKVQMVEHPSQRLAIRSPQVARSTSTIQSRPLSADDIQKAKMRAQFMMSKHGKTAICPDEKPMLESLNKGASSQASFPPPVPIPYSEPLREFDVQTEVKEEMKLDNAVSEPTKPQETALKLDNAVSEPTKLQGTALKLDNAVSEPTKPQETSLKLDNSVSEPTKPQETALDMKEPPWKKFKRTQIPWRTPPEVEIMEEWCVGDGSNSKEVEVQKNRIRREREIVYRSALEIPLNPKEPWDREMDPDDTLTPEIPIEQLPDVEPLETPSVAPVASTSSENNIPGPDLELLAELLKNPELVFALTSGQAGNLSGDATVKLLDMIKANGASSLSELAGNAQNKVEVSLPSPTPSTELVPNGTRPDFSRNPFSRQLVSANGNVYQSTTTILAPQPAAQSAHVVEPSRQTTAQLPEQWHAHLNNTQTHHQSRFNTSHTQHFTTETMLNANSNRAASNNVVGGYNVVKQSPVSILMPPSRSVTPPPQSAYFPEQSNSSRNRQSFDPNYRYQNNRNANDYDAYAGRPGQALGRNNLVGRPEFESWGPNNSPPRHREYLPGPYYRDQNVNSRHGYIDERERQQNIGGAGNKRWREHRR
ncbi:hypothetical protein CASFOL_009973 [Castilleja foliolosa]|uniref:Homeobox domain-containing protein n=1 Tax=Castilleja foliolosa TaxID=1961234 RepID=A0ABD3DRT4_9LAMI